MISYSGRECREPKEHDYKKEQGEEKHDEARGEIIIATTPTNQTI